MRIIMWRLVSFVLVFWCFHVLNAQVGINTIDPDSSAALDIVSPENNQGVLFPRMTSVQKSQIKNPAHGLLVYDTTNKSLSTNVGTENAPYWMNVAPDPIASRSFYMPSIAVNVSRVGVVAQPLDLYAEYKKQFNTPTVVSEGAPASIPFFARATDIYYYITYYDQDVLKITNVSADGKVSYEVLKKDSYASFFNVVFVVK